MGLRGRTTDGASHSRLGSEFGEHEVPTGAESVSSFVQLFWKLRLKFHKLFSN